MTREELAAKLNGRQYGSDVITDAEEAEALRAGLVVVYGASDDLMEFRGAIHDEEGCYEGGTVSLDEDGLMKKECESDDCPHEAKRFENAKHTIEACWTDPDADFDWSYKTKIPHSTFEIFDGESRYCRGIVFSTYDLK